MRILADENMMPETIAGLRDEGHDVDWAYETYRGTPDTNLLNIATDDGRLLITYDKDYGALVHQFGAVAPFGVILFRIHDDILPEAEVQFIVNSVNILENWPPGLWTIQIRHSD